LISLGDSASRLSTSRLDDPPANFELILVVSSRQAAPEASEEGCPMLVSSLRAIVCALAVWLVAVEVQAVEPAAGSKPAAAAKSAAKPEATTIELFAGIESGEIEVKVIPKDATGGNIMVKNKTDKPLTIKVPEAFAGVPVLAQLCGGGCLGGGGFGGCGGGGGGNQGFGGGMMGGMGGGMGGMMGGGMFNVAPEKVTKIKFVAVCLDHGLKDPNPHVEYTLVPIESYAKDPAVTEVVKLLAKGKLDQHSAQAAAWHLQNGLSWKELAQKVGAKHLDGSVEPYFTALHLRRATAAARFAEEQAKTSESSESSQTSASSAAQQGE
jgi:hypothetical protein